MVRNMNVGVLMTCPQCWSGMYNSYVPNLVNTLRENGWWIIGSLRKYDFRTYYLLTREVGFGDYKEKDRWKNFKQVVSS